MVLSGGQEDILGNKNQNSSEVNNKQKIFPLLLSYAYLIINRLLTKALAGMMDSESYEPQLVAEEHTQNWEDKCRLLSEKLNNLQHEKTKIEIEIRNDLEFQRKRANQFEEKFKNAIKYKNEEEQLKKLLNEMSEKLTAKENQILDYIKADQERKRRVSELSDLNQQLTKTNEQIRQQLSQIKQGAISAILEKDSVISSLQQKLIQYQNLDLNQYQTLIVELEEKCKYLQQKAEQQKLQYKELVESKEQELRELREKYQTQRQRYEQRINILEHDVVQYQSHIEKIKQERNHEENLEEKYYILQQKQRKTEKKLQETENSYKNQKQNLLDAVQKLQADLSSKGEQTEQLKNTQNKLRQLQKQLKNKKKQLQDGKGLLQKTKTDYLKKITQLEQEKKKVQDSLDLKSSQLDRTRAQIEQSKVEVKTPEKKQKKINEKDLYSLSSELQNLPSVKSSRRQSLQQSNALVEKLKAQIKSLEDNIDELNVRLAQQTREVQTLREKLVATSGSASRSEGEAKLLVEIEDLNSYIKKVQHNLMITKLKYANDENHWYSKEQEMKKQMDKLDRKCKKEKAQLLERIDRMKKTTVNSKKTDYYQSSLK